MKVLYDHQTVLTQSLGGVSRYFVGLMKTLSGMGVKVLCPLPGPDALEQSRNVYALAVPHCFQKPSWVWRLLTWLVRRLRPAKVGRVLELRQRLQRAEVVHAGQFHYTQRELLRHPRLVTTVHDMIHEDYFLKLEDVPDWAPPCSRVKQSYVEHSAHIIAISHYTRERLMTLWGVPTDKITVVHHSNPFEGVELPPRRQENSPFLLFVGARGYYKNFPNFIRAAAPLLRDYPALRIVCTGNAGFSNDEILLMESLGIADRTLHASVSDAELVQLYVDAELFCFPSFMEGFGLPILEAFSCGCPVCCADATCFPEVAGDAACYFNPESVADMEAAMRRVLEDADYRDSLIAAGRRRVALFTRQKTAEATLQVYLKCKGE